MGNKANPRGLRLGIVSDWDCTWFATADYPKLILEDRLVKGVIRSELARAGVSDIRIKRKADFCEVIATVARPGVIFGKSGFDLDAVKKDLEKKTKKKYNIVVQEEKDPDLSARLVAAWVTGQLERRIPFRRAMKMAMQRVMKAGAEGIKISCSGRLGGVEIARTEWYKEGKIPLHTFRADIDYAFTEALTTFGKIGVKVWIYKGEILKKKDKYEEQQQPTERVRLGRG